jgi:hypothetical protein
MIETTMPTTTAVVKAIVGPSGASQNTEATLRGEPAGLD